MLCARDETSEEEMQKKTEERFLSVRYFFLSFSFFVRTRGETEKEKHNTRKRERERERERERTQHARSSSLSRFSIIIVSDLYQRDREKEWLRERFE